MKSSKKCPVCFVGTWVVGLSAVGWGVAALMESTLEMSGTLRVIAGVIGVTGLGFLWFQPPFKPCPKCVSANEGKLVCLK